jgi:integrase
MLSVEQERQIFEAAPPYLRVAIILLVQTGGRTYSEGLSLRWDQVDLEKLVIHLAGELKTSESAQPVQLTRQACELLHEWKNEQGAKSPFLFPSPRDFNRPIGSVKKAWRTALKRSGVSYFPIYNLPCILHATELCCSRRSRATRHAP